MDWFTLEWFPLLFFRLRVRLGKIGWTWRGRRRPLIVWYLAHGQHPAYRLEVVVFGEKDAEQRVIATRDATNREAVTIETNYPFNPDIPSDRSPLREISADLEAPGAPLRFIQAMYAVIEDLCAGEDHLTPGEKHFVRDLYRDLGGTRALGLQIPTEQVFYLGDQRERDYRLEIVSYSDGLASLRIIPTREATNPQARVFHFQPHGGETSGQWRIEGSRGVPALSQEQVDQLMESFRGAIETISAAEKTQLSPGERLFLFHLYRSIGGTRDLGE